MTGIATGGFTVTDDSFAGYGTVTQLVALTVIAVGAVSFVAHHLLLVERDPWAWWRFTPTRAQVGWWTLGLGGLFALGRWSDPDLGAVNLAFQWLSAAGTAGFATHENLSGWGTVLLLVLIVGWSSGRPAGQPEEG